MKNSLSITVLCAILLYSYNIFGQTTDDIGLSELKTPSSPAFTILGVQPTDISRPKSYQALETSLFNASGAGGSLVLPNSYALEFSPFWISNHPDLTFDNYVEPNIPNSILQNLSISIATTELKNTTDTSIVERKIGFGLRTMIISGSLPKEVKTLVSLISVNQLLVLDAISPFQFVLLNDPSIKTREDLVTKAQAEFNSRKAANSFTNPDSVQQVINNFIKPFLVLSNASMHNEWVNEINVEIFKKLDDYKTTKEINAAAQKLREMNKDYYGFMLEFAGGLVLDFPIGTFDYSGIPKYGIWLTPTYRVEDRSFEASLLFRLSEITPHDSTTKDHSGRKINFRK